MNDLSTKMCPQCGSAITSEKPDAEQISSKSGVAALLLCMFFGVLGVHRFYVGKIGTGILMLLTWGGLGIWAFVDLIIIACCQFTDKEGKRLVFTRTEKFPWKLVLGIIGAFIALVILWAILVSSFAFYASNELTRTIDDQLDALRSGNFDKAYTYTSRDFKEKIPLEKFKQYVEQHPELKDNVGILFYKAKMKNDAGIIEGKLETTDGLKTFVEYRLIKEGDTWKILEIQMPPVHLNEIED